MSEIVFYLARARNGVIGNAGAIPWHIPGELARFKALTMDKPVVMGRKTWDSLPKKPLPGRLNIVLTRDMSFSAAGAVAVHSVEDALAAAAAAAEIAIIGGAQIYALFLPRAHRIEITEIDADVAGDATLPPFDRTVWREVAREPHRSEAGLAYAYVTLMRQ